MANVNPTVANLQGQLTAGLNQLASLGVNVNGGGGAPAAGATTAAARQQARPDIEQLTGITARGQQIAVIKDNVQGLYRLAAGTNQDEKVTVQDGASIKTLLFDGSGKNVRYYEVADRDTVKVDLDRRQGIATGITNLSKVVAGRQERLKALTEALAQDSNENGNTNQVDIQRLVQEQQVTEHLSNMNKKIYDSVQAAITPWLR
jgi:hypothetical protein